MITNRDMKVVDFLSEFKIAKTSTIVELFYDSYRVAAKRLTELVNMGQLSRERGGWSSEYYYFIKKPKQLRHAMFLTDFYRELHKVATINKFIPKPTLGNIRPDALVEYQLNGVNRLAIIEIELSPKSDNGSKYDSFDWSAHLEYKPELIVVTSLRYECSKYKLYKIGTDLDLSSLIEANAEYGTI